MALVSHRDTLLALCPPWLRRLNAGRLMYALGAVIDAQADALIAGLKLRFPNVYSAESLPLIGRERRIRRGRTESNATYASRLTRWLDDHKLRGGPYPLLRQLHAYYAPANFKIELVYASGRRFTLFADGTITRDDMAVPGSWNPPGAGGVAKWARWWLFFHWPTPVDNDGTWGDPGVYSDGGVWDSNLTPDQVADLRRVPNDWHAAHAIGRLVLLSPGLEIADFLAGTPGTAQVGLG
jgi:hypothetical protein